MTRTRAAAALVGLLALAVTDTAIAGTISSATGPITINGRVVTVEPGKPIELAEGDTVSCGDAIVEWVSASGDRVTLDKGSTFHAEGVANGVDHLFVDSGAAYGDLSGKTAIGSSSGWMSAPAGQKVKALLQVPTERAGGEATFRAISGSAYIRYHDYTTMLPEQHTVTMAVDPSSPATLAFRTSQQNAGDIEVRRKVGGGELIAFVPKATIGRLAPTADGKTRIENDITSLKTGKIRIETRFGGTPQRAALGPGTYAFVDNETGSIEVSFTAVEFVILDRAISLTSEFATLSQSNFSDVGDSTGGPGRR